MNVEQVDKVVRKWLAWADERVLLCPEMKVASFAYGVSLIPEAERMYSCTCGWSGAHKNFDSHTIPNPDRAWMRTLVSFITLSHDDCNGTGYILNEHFAWLVEHVPAAAAAWVEQALRENGLHLWSNRWSGADHAYKGRIEYDLGTSSGDVWSVGHGPDELAALLDAVCEIAGVEVSVER